MDGGSKPTDEKDVRGLPVRNQRNRSVYIGRAKQGVHTVPPTSPLIAHPAQPAEVELTDEDIKKFDLFTQEEINIMTGEQMELIRQTPFEALKTSVDAIRKRRQEKA